MKLMAGHGIKPDTPATGATVTIISIWSKVGRSDNIKYDIQVPRSDQATAMLEAAFALTNRDDRPQSRQVCATTAGDIMVIDGNHFLVEPCGFHPLTPAESEKIQKLDSLQTGFGYENLVRSGKLNGPEPTAPVPEM